MYENRNEKIFIRSEPSSITIAHTYFGISSAENIVALKKHHHPNASALVDTVLTAVAT